MKGRYLVTVIKIGNFNKLKILRRVDFGLYLQGDEDEEILLPRRFAPEGAQVGDDLEVFLYYDSEDRLIATTETPLARVGDFAFLKIASVTDIGAFLDWGLPKELFLPFAEQTRALIVGKSVAVAIYIDKSFRIASSMRLDRYADKVTGDYKENQKVELFIVGKSDLGYKAIINDKHVGVLYNNEVFQDLHYGQRLPGFIKKIRGDGKIDLNLQALGSFGAADLGQKIIQVLKANGGFVNITDKSTAESVYELFGVSKKKFKMALGGLYKKRLVTIGEDGIRLAP